MAEEKKVVPKTDPEKAAPGKGAPGNQEAVQTAQTTAVNPPDAAIPANSDPIESVEQVEALEKQEEAADVETSAGYTMDESGRLDNFAVEPDVYVEE